MGVIKIPKIRLNNIVNDIKKIKLNDVIDVNALAPPSKNKQEQPKPENKVTQPSIFSAKEGGTDVGNIIRGISYKISDGILGNGDNMIPVTTTKSNTVFENALANVNLSPRKVGEIAGSFLYNNYADPLIKEQLQKVAQNKEVKGIISTITDVAVNEAQQSIMTKIIAFVKKYWWVVLPLSVIVVYKVGAWVMGFFKRKGSQIGKGKRGF